jgi:hypothetical protein
MIFLEEQLSKQDKDRIRSEWRNKHNPPPPPAAPPVRYVKEGGSLIDFIGIASIFSVPILLSTAIGYAIGIGQ